MKRFCSMILMLLLIFGLFVPGYAATGEENAPAVVMRTELDTYSTDTDRILVTWENNSVVPLTFGNHFALQKKVGEGKWRPVRFKENIAFNDIGYELRPGESRRHIYSLDGFAEVLTPGEYRIKIPYTYVQEPGEYNLTVRFQMVEPAAYKGVSELDRKGLEEYREIYRDDLLQKTTAHIYQHPQTYHTVVVYGKEQYPIALGSGGWGITSLCYQELGGREYLLYAYSRGYGGEDFRAQIGVLDLMTGEEVYTSKVFHDWNLGVGQSEEGNPAVFSVSAVRYTENPGGGYVEEFAGEIGRLRFQNGEFILEEFSTN